MLDGPLLASCSRAWRNLDLDFSGPAGLEETVESLLILPLPLVAATVVAVGIGAAGKVVSIRDTRPPTGGSAAAATAEGEVPRSVISFDATSGLFKKILLLGLAVPAVEPVVLLVLGTGEASVHSLVFVRVVARWFRGVSRLYLCAWLASDAEADQESAHSLIRGACVGSSSSLISSTPAVRSASS
jgi:hypothetical protein